MIPGECIELVRIILARLVVALGALLFIVSSVTALVYWWWQSKRGTRT